MPTDLERFMAKVRIAENGCWLWTAAKTHGYGNFKVGGRPWRAHRWSYEYFVGPIPKNLAIDHLCHNRDQTCHAGDECLHRSCVNPEHLEATDHRTNILRGHGHAARNAVALTCKRGHPLEGDNLLILEDGRRQCRTCVRARVSRWQTSPKGRANEKRYAQTPQRRAYLEQYKTEHAEEMAEYQRRYYQQNRERALELQRKRKEADPEGHAARQREYRRRYYEKHAEEIRAKRRARRAANLEAERERDREYRRRKRAKKRAD